MLLALFFFFFNDPTTTEIYTLSLHDALPIYLLGAEGLGRQLVADLHGVLSPFLEVRDRKSTRLNSSHLGISYAVFCLKKKTTVVDAGERRRLTNHPERDPSHVRNL